jgi:hypothetical protein
VFVNNVSKGLVVCLFITAYMGCASAQTDEAEALKKAEPAREDTHMFGIVPDFDTVRNSSGVILPISSRTKFWLATEDVFDPFSFAISGIYAGASQWSNQYHEFGQGASGYAKRYGGAFADQAIGNYLTEAAFPVLLRQDPRYFRMGPTAGFWKRIGYSASRVVVTRGDSGTRQFNFSEVVGNGVAAGISAAYYPGSSQHVEEVCEKWALNVTSDAGFNILKEFWPDMRHKLFGK